MTKKKLESELEDLSTELYRKHLMTYEASKDKELQKGSDYLNVGRDQFAGRAEGYYDSWVKLRRIIEEMGK